MSKKLLTTEQIRNYLMSVNAHLFENPLSAVAHDLIITGFMKKKGEDDWEENFIQRTKPNEQAKAVGIADGRYLRASVKKHVDLSAGFRGSKKPVAANIFESAQPEMFNYFKNLIFDEKTKQLLTENFSRINDGVGGGDSKNKENLPIIRMALPVYGKIITMLVPNYKPQVTDAEGNRTALKAGRYNHFDKKYEKDEVTMDTLTFFADEDDLEKLLSVATKLFQSQVEPYAVGDVVETVSIGNKVVAEKIKDPKPVQEGEDNIDPNDIP